MNESHEVARSGLADCGKSLSESVRAVLYLFLDDPSSVNEDMINIFIALGDDDDIVRYFQPGSQRMK